MWKQMSSLAIIVVLAAVAWGAGRKPAAPSNSLADLPAALESGRPTLAYVYYSVACSCTAAHCAIAESALDSAIAEDGYPGKVNVIKVDGYSEIAADSVFGVGFVPLIVHYDKSGEETGRIEWEISKQMIEDMVAGRIRPSGEIK